MYYFNYKLLSRLPKILGITEKEICSSMGIFRRAYASIKQGKVTCETLVRFCNTYRISMSHILVTTENPKEMHLVSDYVVPRDEWKPIAWSTEICSSLFGRDNSLTGVTKQEALRRLGFSSTYLLDYWVKNPSALRMDTLINMLNEFKLDGAMFFKDDNLPISIPTWVNSDIHIADLVSQRLDSVNQMHSQINEKEQTIRTLRAENNRLRKENLGMRVKSATASGASNGRVGESPVAHATPFAERGYVFHRELWTRLPEMFHIGIAAYLKKAGITSRSIYSDCNIHTDDLIRVCNMLRISISHFFVPKSEVKVVYDRTYYEISPRLFRPIESRMDNMKYLFGRYGILDASVEDLGRISGVWNTGFVSMQNDGDRSRVFTLADICSRFNIPPWIFFHDENESRHKADYSQSQNERLLLNAIGMMKEIEELRTENRRLRKKLEALKNPKED